MKYLGKDLATLGIPADEPVVLLRAGNPFAAHLLRDYAARLEESGRPGVAEKARNGADEIAAYQSAFPPVLPDEPLQLRRGKS